MGWEKIAVDTLLKLETTREADIKLTSKHAKMITNSGVKKC